jgi:hypothetical protein
MPLFYFGNQLQGHRIVRLHEHLFVQPITTKITEIKIPLSKPLPNPGHTVPKLRHVVDRDLHLPPLLA